MSNQNGDESKVFTRNSLFNYSAGGSIFLLLTIFLIFSYNGSNNNFENRLNSNFIKVSRSLALRGRHNRNHNSSGIFILPIDGEIPEPLAPWGAVVMPSKSFFQGFDAPNDTIKWKIAQLQASRGEQILLSKVLRDIKTPLELCPGDITFKWVHRISDIFISTDGADAGLAALKDYKGPRIPIAMLGYRKFTHGDFEGNTPGYKGFGPDNLLNSKQFTIPRKFIGVGNMDENWGWLSTYFHNRTVSWAVTIAPNNGDYLNEKLNGLAAIGKFLDDPNLVMLAVNQHHNITHPKVISFPLGIKDRKGVYESISRAAKNGLPKDMLFFSASSDWGPRPMILKCISDRMGDEMSAIGKISAHQYRIKLISSRAVLCMSGLGYDTYRMWETLASGSMPVAERGIGLDRTLYRLPVLLVDDFYDLTPDLIRGAYVEALYRADEWDYNRITQKWWERLLYEVSEAGTIEPLLRLHPMSAVDTTFTRPLWRFNCTAIGGCGKGTKRIPEHSCGINENVSPKNYNWHIWN